MTCQDHRRRFTELLEGALDADRRAELERHLDECSDCASEWTLLRATIAALGDLPPMSPPPDLRGRVVAAFVERHHGDAAERHPAALRAADSIFGLRLSPTRAWALSAGAIAASLLLSFASGPGGALDRPGAPRLCLPVIAVAGLLPALTLLAQCLGRRRRAPTAAFAFSASVGALAGQLVLFALCPLLDSRTHAVVLHTGVLSGVTLLGILLAFVQRLRPVD